MCGRFALSAKTKSLEKLLPNLRVEEDYKPRYNIAPSQNILAVTNTHPETLTELRWGLIPFWAKDMKIGFSLINARAESISEKPAFRNSFKTKRCLIFADGYYEWKKIDGLKDKFPYYIKLKSGEPFTFAGLWDIWKNQEGNKLCSTTIITTDPNHTIAEIHDRMPAIIPSQYRELWLSNETHSSEELIEMLKPYPDEEIELFPVSKLINSPKNDSIDCISHI